MPTEWAGLSPELLLPLDRELTEPLRSQLERGLREAIRSGRLEAGERLPSSRELAGALGVSRGLVQDCYGQLHAEGYLATRVGSATRVAAVGSRVAPAPAAAALTEAIAAEKRLSDRGSPVLDQFAVAALIESGRYDRHLRRMRTTYAKRRDALVDTLARHAPTVDLTGLAAGFHAVAHLPDSVDEQAVVAAARARSVGLYGMSACRATRSRTPPQLVLGFGNLTERSIQAGIAAVGDLLDGRTT